MAHVIPTLRSVSHPLHTLPAMRRNPAPTNEDNSNTGAFSTVLKESTPAAAAPTAPTTPATPIGTIGTMSPWPPPTVAAPPPTTTSKMAPTAQSLFGDSPWSTTAGGTGLGGDYSYNKYFFATPATAAKVAQMLGGTVVAMDAITPSGPFKQNQPNLMVKMPNGKLINAGLVAAFYDRGYMQQTVDSMIAGEVNDLG